MSFPIHARFAHPDAGYAGDQRLAAEHLTVGQIYTLTGMQVGQSSTILFFQEVAGQGFNSVMFEPADLEFADEEPPAPVSVPAALAGIRAIGAATNHLDGACWLCQGLGGVAIHLKWSAERGEGKRPLWTAHEYPSDDPHPVEPCPACALSASLAAVEAAVALADELEATPWPYDGTAANLARTDVSRGLGQILRAAITAALTGKEEGDG